MNFTRVSNNTSYQTPAPPSLGGVGGSGGSGAYPSVYSSATPTPPPPTLYIDVSNRVYVEGSKRYVLLSEAIKSPDAGLEKQTLCTEMLHWDALREEMQQNNNNNAPAFTRMASLFDPRNLMLDSYIDNSTEYWPKSVAVQPYLFKAPKQTFCSEMLHYDDYMEELTTNGGSSGSSKAGAASPGASPRIRMTDMFLPAPFIHVDILKITNREKKMEVMSFVTRSKVFEHIRVNNPWQTCCTEMIHFDDWLMDQGRAPAGGRSMVEIFGRKR